MTQRFSVILECSGMFAVVVEAPTEAEASRIALDMNPQHYMPPFSTEHMNMYVSHIEILED
jgi:hypothetical protein